MGPSCRRFTLVCRFQVFALFCGRRGLLTHLRIVAVLKANRASVSANTTGGTEFRGDAGKEEKADRAAPLQTQSPAKKIVQPLSHSQSESSLSMSLGSSEATRDKTPLALLAPKDLRSRKQTPHPAVASGPAAIGSSAYRQDSQGGGSGTAPVSVAEVMVTSPVRAPLFVSFVLLMFCWIWLIGLRRLKTRSSASSFLTQRVHNLSRLSKTNCKRTLRKQAPRSWFVLTVQSLQFTRN